MDATVNSRRGEREAAKQRTVQKKVDADDRRKQQSKPKPMQAGARKYPVPPFPKQHHPKPGMEHAIEPAPMYDAPFYKGSIACSMPGFG